MTRGPAYIPGMLQLIWFGRYALRFERAFRDDDWGPVRACFHEDATYTMTGGGPFSGETRGGDAIVALFKRMLDQFDRRFERRTPKITSLPRIGWRTLRFRWQARYLLGDESFLLRGETSCHFDGRRIRALRDDMNVEDCRRGAEFMKRFGAA